MKTITWKTLVITGLAVAAFTSSTPAAPADKPEKKPSKSEEMTIVVEQVDLTDESTPETVTVDVDVVKPGKYYLGVVCSPLDSDLVKSQLGLKHGIVITGVVEGSPAAKVGLKKQDILIRVGERELSDLKVLVEATQEAEQGELTLTLYRGGKQQTVEVAPSKRPVTIRKRGLPDDEESVAEWKMLQEALRKHGAISQDATEAAKEATKMLRVMPGILLPQGAKGFPKNLEVTITKKGEKPAEIKIRRGDETWEVDEESLDKLPEDIRVHVNRMMGGGLSIKLGTDGFDWSSNLPKSLIIPHLKTETLKNSFKVAPGQHLEFHEFSKRLPAEMKKKIDIQLKQAQKDLKAAQSQVSDEVLQKIQDELKELRKQLEQLREQKSDKKDDKAA